MILCPNLDNLAGKRARETSRWKIFTNINHIGTTKDFSLCSE